MEKKCKIIYLNNFIYILSNDEIKEGDWYINTFATCDVIPQTHSNIKQLLNHKKDYRFKECKKIIATTDTSLKYYIDGKGNKLPYELTKSGYIEFLPQPSQQFIEKYIESYNKGDIITNVLVEYENKFDGKEYVDDQDAYGYDKFKQVLKVNPKDNTITIKKLKDSWNRKEVINLLDLILFEKDLNFDKWIEKNL